MADPDPSPPPPAPAPTPSLLAGFLAPDSPWPRYAPIAVLGMVIALRVMGRTWWCKCGSPVPWTLDMQSLHGSQHLVDVYSFTHTLHGFVFYALLALVLPRAVPRVRLGLAIVLEASWELLENSNFIIEKYRAATISLDYFGDSIGNSLGDVACCTLGFLIARRLPVRASIAIFVAVELLLLALIRDNLTLNVVMLTFPLEAVKRWQHGG